MLGGEKCCSCSCKANVLHYPAVAGENKAALPAWHHRPYPQLFSFLHCQPSFINSCGSTITNLYNFFFLPEGSPLLLLPAGTCESLPAGSCSGNSPLLVRKSYTAAPAGTGERIQEGEGELGWVCGANIILIRIVPPDLP